MDALNFDRSLANPKFQGYKLDAAQQDAVSRIILTYKPSQASVSGNIPLSFKEMRSRISHNHLAVDSERGRLVYIDANYRVILVDLDPQVDDAPVIRVIHEMPVPIQTHSSETTQREYPTAAFMSATSLLVADGQGRLYVVPIKDDAPSDAIGSYRLCTDGNVESPFLIHHVRRDTRTSAVAIISSRHTSASEKIKVCTSMIHQDVSFDIRAVKIDLLSLHLGAGVHDLNAIWERRGQDIPTYTSFVESTAAYLIVAASSFSISPDADISYQPSIDEIAPIPRQGENLDTDPFNDAPSKPQPYSWTQTSDSVTIAFPLPSITDKNKINVFFSSHTLTLHIADQSSEWPLPRYSATPLWGDITPSSSFWTWDREGGHQYGLLTLHIEKRHEGTRWTDVFAPPTADTSTDAPPDAINVPETVDPSELWHIRESLEKYTSSMKDGTDPSGLGLGVGTPSLMQGEMDMEVDASVGRTSFITWISEDGSQPAWSVNHKNDALPFQLLSTPLPGLKVDDAVPVTLVIKNDIDGSLFALETKSSSSSLPLAWTHAENFNALAFVLASKMDTRFFYHVPGNAVFAFESGVRDRGGNVYIYRATAKKDVWGKEAILKVDDGRGGPLLGVGAVYTAAGKQVIVCLTEGELVMINA